MEASKPARPGYANGSKKRRKKSTASLNGDSGQRRAASEGRQRASRKKDVSRESSTGSSAMSLDVRCGCQYFQSDALLPDRINPVGTRPGSRTSHLVTRIGDHEYEPVNPPPDDAPLASIPPPTVQITDTNQGSRQKPISSASSTTSLERRMLGEPEPESPEPQYTAEEMQCEIENRFFKEPQRTTPSVTVQTEKCITTTTTTDTKKQSKEKQPPGPSKKEKFQEAFKSQTDRLRTKLQGIKKPSLPSRSKTEKPKPDKPKPEKTKAEKIPKPEKPKAEKPKAEKPSVEKPKAEKSMAEKFKLNFPKIPDTTTIHLPTFSLPRRSTTTKRTLKERQLSTESNAGDSKKKFFDFGTYPRIFKKKPAPSAKQDFDSSSSKDEVPEFATVPRVKRARDPRPQPKEEDRWAGSDTIRVPLKPLKPEESFDSDRTREDSLERRMASHMRYDEDIDIDDAYEKENQEIHRASPFSNNFQNARWNHGSFHPESSSLEFRENLRNREYKVTDLDSPGDGPPANESFDTSNNSKDVHSSESSLGIHRRGVLEEIDSDEFFLRQKGISQDNIEIGTYLSSEIREAFKSPTNALSELQRDPHESNQSLPESPSKRKVIKKPKRKKTPHVSQEQIAYDQEDDDSDVPELELLPPPARPKRRSKKKKKTQQEDVVPYQETIAMEEAARAAKAEYEDGYEDDDEVLMYQNEQMEGKEQPKIKVSDPYAGFKYSEAYESDEEDEEEIKNFKYREEAEMFQDRRPEAPPRKQRSLKSLDYSEQDSIMGDFNFDRDIPQDADIVYKSEHEYIIPTPELPPTKPPRTLSRSSSHSLRDHEGATGDLNGAPSRPNRSRSRSKPEVNEDFEEPPQQPCVEEPCTQDIRDYMGYAIIDKNQKREPPLPPPRTPPRRKRSLQSQSKVEQRFFTVPRNLNDTTTSPPVRPLRNYSTLGPSRPPRKKPVPNMTDEEKQSNVDISQYIEIEDQIIEDHSRDFPKSGEVIQKIQNRPLPAPPRPTRKKRSTNGMNGEEGEPNNNDEQLDWEETEVSTQTEPLPDDFICEDVRPEDTDTVITPSRATKQEDEGGARVEKRLITPTHYTYEEETVTHGTLLVEPLNGARILRDSQLTRVERTIPVEKDYDETSDIPEEFHTLRDPVTSRPSSTTPQIIERIIERPMSTGSEFEVLRAQKLQVTDLDVDRLSVNELLASKIVVSEIESGNIQVSEIGSKSGALRVGEIELPPGVVQQLFERLQSAAQEQQQSAAAAQAKKEEEEQQFGQKKTPIEQLAPQPTEGTPERPPRKTEETPETAQVDDVDADEVSIHSQTVSLNTVVCQEIDGTAEEPQEIVGVESVENEEVYEREPPQPPQRIDSQNRTAVAAAAITEDAPQRPPRQSGKSKPDSETEDAAAERTEEQQRSRMDFEQPEVDDEPPPRPPQPQMAFPSQPPASFYALRAQQYVDDYEGDDIPMAPRRRRHHKKPPISRSTSEESPAPAPSRRRYRSPDPSIAQLTGQLIHACGSATDGAFKRLISHITENVLGNADGKQDLHVMIVILLVLIAGLILLGYGGDKTVHHHHWEYFNPPRDM